MPAWLTMLKKDMSMLRSQWLGFLGLAVAAAAAALTANLLGILGARLALTVGIGLACTPLVAFPAQVYRGINKEMKESAVLWLQTPQSGWAMLGSKMVSSLIGSLICLVVCYGLALALIGSVNLAHTIPPLQLHAQAHSGGVTISTVHGAALATLGPTQLSVLIAQIPRVVGYLMLVLLGYGVYLAMWVMLIYMSARMAKLRRVRLVWLVCAAEILAATWVLGWLRSTVLYERLFGWGRVPAADLFPAGMRPLLSGPAAPALVAGHLVFYAVIVVLLFWLTGLIVDRHLEV